MSKIKTIYIAGPMSGYPQFNFPAFFAAQKVLESQGWKVYNPAQKDLEASLDPTSVVTGDAKKAIAAGFDFREAFGWDLDKVIRSDAVYMLRGWEHSPGAKAEHAAATAMQKHYPEYEIHYETAYLSHP